MAGQETFQVEELFFHVLGVMKRRENLTAAIRGMDPITILP